MSEHDGTDEVGGGAQQPMGQPSWQLPPSPPLPVLSPLESLDGGHVYDLDSFVPVEPVRRSKRPWIIGTAVAAVLVLVGGAVAAALVLHRPDVTLQRALSSTLDSSTGSATLSVKADLTGLDAPAHMQTIVDSARVRLAWDRPSSTSQLTVSVSDGQLLDVITGPESIVVSQGLATSGVVPEADSMLSSLRDFADSLGTDGAALTAFADGTPVRITTGPDSALGKLIKQAQEQAGSASPSPDAAGVGELKAALEKSVREHITVTRVGGDDAGDHLRATLPLQPVVDEVKGKIATLAGLGSIPTDLTTTAVLEMDVWVKDGVVSRLELPLGSILRAGDPAAPDVTLVVDFGTDGIVAPSATPVDVPDSLFDSLGPFFGGGDTSAGGGFEGS